MADSTTAERKHHPTATRLRKSREQGNVAVSRDLSASVALLAATGAILSTGSWMLHQINVWIVNGLSGYADAGLKPLVETDLARIVTRGAIFLAVTVGPVAGAAAGAAVFLSGIQTNFNFATGALKIDFGRLSPAKGIQRFTPAKTGLDTLKTICVAIVLVWLSWPVLKGLVLQTEQLAWTGPVASITHGWGEALRLLWRAGFALLALGAADYGIQKWRYIDNLKMTDQELKEDHKQQESNPEVKARIRRIRLQMFRNRMMKAVPKATVVLTNPTHYAVALEYRREKNVAPVVVAKGQDLIAAKIREIARQHSVPIIENPSLTRALFKECEIGDTIPGPLFGAVAEILAYLIRIKQLVL